MKNLTACKSSRIDLAAIEAHLLIIRPGKCLEICIVTIQGWRTKGALPPFLEYWGGYSPPAPPVPTPMTIPHIILNSIPCVISQYSGAEFVLITKVFEAD